MTIEISSYPLSTQIKAIIQNWFYSCFSSNQRILILKNFKESMVLSCPKILKNEVSKLKSGPFEMEEAVSFLHNSFMLIMKKFDQEFSGCCDLLREKTYREGLEKMLNKMTVSLCL